MKSIADILEQDSRERFERAQKNRIEDDWYYSAPLGGSSSPAPSLNSLELSGLTSNGLVSSGIINGATSGSTITSNVTGLVVNSTARTYAFDGTASAATVANGLVETLGALTKNNAVTVLPAATGTLKLSGRMFFTGQPATFMILAGYLSNSILTCTSDDGTTLTVGTSMQGYPLVIGTFATPGVKTITITEALNAGGSNVSTMPVVLRAVPAVAVLAKAKATAGRVRASYNSRIALAVGPTPPTVTWNTGNSLVNGRTLAAGGSTATTSVPDGQRGPAGLTAAATGYIYADTTLGTASKGYATGRSKRFLFNSDHFDFKISCASSGTGGMGVMILYTEDFDTANPTWYMHAAKAARKKVGTVYYFDVQFASLPARATSRAVEVVVSEAVAMTGFNFLVTPTAITIDKPQLMSHNDSYDFGASVDSTIFTSCGIAGERLGTPNAVLMGHRTNAWSRLGGTTGVHGFVMDRVSSNPWGMDELTRFGKLDVWLAHAGSINDFVVQNFVSLGTATASPKFNNAGGSNSFVPGITNFTNMLQLAFWRARLAQPEALIVVDVGVSGPDNQANATHTNALLSAFSAAFDADPAAVLVNWIAGTYRWMGQSFSISGFTAPLVASGAVGSSQYFPAAAPTSMTATITGDVLDVSAVTGTITKNIAYTAGQVAAVTDFLTGSGGTGTYTLTYPPGDAGSTVYTAGTAPFSDKDHPNDPGYQKFGELRADAALFCADKALSA